MPTLASIQAPYETVALQFRAETVHITYRPQYLTPEFEERLKTLGIDENRTAAFLALFCGLVVAWDLKYAEDDPAAIPITPEALRLIPYDILAEIVNRVQERVVPNPPTGPGSDGGSPPAATSETSPTGTR